MSQFDYIRSAFAAAEREGGGAQLSTAAAVRGRQVPQSANAGSLKARPPSRKRPILKNNPKSTKTGSSRSLQTPTKVSPGDGGILIAVMGAAGSGKSYFCRVAAEGDDAVIGERSGSRSATNTPLKYMC